MIWTLPLLKLKPTNLTGKTVKPVSRLVVFLTIAFCLSAILGYIAMEYGFASIPEFLLVAVIVIIVVPLILLFSPFLS